MKLICSKSNLLHGVNIVSKAVPTRTTMAILECILIDASANEIKLTANDMELGIETKIEGEIAERGIIALDAKIFSEIVRKLPDSDVVIETDSNFKTTITCEKSKFNIVGKSVTNAFITCTGEGSMYAGTAPLWHKNCQSRIRRHNATTAGSLLVMLCNLFVNGQHVSFRLVRNLNISVHCFASCFCCH